MVVNITLEEKLINAMESLDEDAVLKYAKLLFEEKSDYYLIQSLLNKGVKEVGRLFEEGEYFIADLIESGIIYNEVLNSFYEHLSDVTRPKIGKIMIAVMKNDIHNIGKNIICSVLRAEGFDVIDLGVDVSPQTIIDHVIKYSPDILALSGVMSYSVEGMKETVDGLVSNGVRSQTAVIIGGTCINKNTGEQVGADACTKDPMETLAFCKRVVQHVKN